MPPHHVLLIPGMFGFGRLAGYDYFAHVRAAVEARFARRGIPVTVTLVPTPPTSSLKHRARILARTIQEAPGSDGPIHLLGHSTGGLDARLLASPTADLGLPASERGYQSRVRSIVSMNTPHYGTPLATYFATVSGTRVLYALSLLTVVSLSLGTSSLSVFARALAALGGVDRLLGGEDFRLITRVTDMLLGYVDSESRQAIETYLNDMRLDQGAIIQITPEAMDVFNVAVEDDERVRYACVATAAPSPTPWTLGKRLLSPYGALSAAMFSTLYTVSSQRHARYGYARPSLADRTTLDASVGRPVGEDANDAVVPTLSMLWGRLIWSGHADHLDVIGHFYGGKRSVHTDWLYSGADFDQHRFGDVMDRIVAFFLEE